MIFVKWIGIVVASVTLVYLSLWLGGGWGEVLTFPPPTRAKVVEILLSVAGAFSTLFIAAIMDDEYEFFEDWFLRVVILAVVAFIFGAIVDPLVIYGLWPWQWLTWWTLLLLPFTILSCFDFYFGYRNDLEFRDYLASEGLWR